MSDKLGAGIKLTEDWDLEVSPTGDIATVSGRSELEKDLAMITAVYFDKHLGETIEPRKEANTLKSIETAVKRILRQEERVQRILNVTARPNPSITDSIVVEVEVVADDRSNHDLIIEVQT